MWVVPEQASAELGGSPSEVREVLARVREALPTVRESSDVGISSEYGDQLELGPRRSRSTAEGVRLSPSSIPPHAYMTHHLTIKRSLTK